MEVKGKTRYPPDQKAVLLQFRRGRAHYAFILCWVSITNCKVKENYIIKNLASFWVHAGKLSSWFEKKKRKEKSRQNKT